MDEVHDTHHPIASSLYYEDQRQEARARTADFLKIADAEIPRLFRAGAGAQHGRRRVISSARSLTYPDLSLFQIVAGLRYAFPQSMQRLEPAYPRVVALHDRVAARARGSPPISPRTAGSRSTSTASSGTTPSWTATD